MDVIERRKKEIMGKGDKNRNRACFEDKGNQKCNTNPHINKATLARLTCRVAFA